MAQAPSINTNTNTLLNTDPASLKKLEKQLAKESKTEHSSVKHQVKDLAHLEKETQRAHKALDKAHHSLAKTEKVEAKTADQLNNAAHKHDVAVANISSAEKNIKLKEAQDAKLTHDLEQKKAQVDSLLAGEHSHNQEREYKLSRIHAARAGDLS